MTITPAIAHAASTDAGNRSMRQHSRAASNEDDLDAAAREYHRLLPCPEDVACDMCNRLNPADKAS